MGLRLIRSKAADNYHGFNPYWYGRWRKQGQKDASDFRLPVMIKGVPPVSGKITDTGDAAFEKSRKAALAAMEKMRDKCRDKDGHVGTLKTIYREQTGRAYDETDVPLKDLGDRVLGRRGAANANNEDWARFIRSIFDAFASYAARNNRTTMLAVDGDFAKGYIDHLSTMYAWETVRKHAYRLSKAFAQYLPKGFDANPFDGVVKETEAANRKITTHAISRKPLTNVELAAVFTEARKHSETLYNVTVCAACTGLRLKDICLLKWTDIDLREMLLTNKNAKTGATVTIPIMWELRDVIHAANTDAAGTDAVYVFPQAAARYLANPSCVAKDGKVIFARALHALAGEPVEEANAPELTQEEKHARILAAIDGAKWSDEKRARIRGNYLMLAGGATYGDITASTGWPKNRTSMDFAEVEDLAGVTFRPHKGTKMRTRQMINAYTQEKRAFGRKGSTYGWHSLRHTFVVRAYEGVRKGFFTEADIALLVGHTTVEQTREYYNPTKKIVAERVRAAFEANKAPASTNPTLAALQSMLANLTPDERAALLMQAAQGIGTATPAKALR